MENRQAVAAEAEAATGFRPSSTPLPDWFTDEYKASLEGLRCTRKGDRTKMVEALRRLGEAYGAVVEDRPGALNETHEIWVSIHLNGARVGIDLDGKSALCRGKYAVGGCFIGNWNIDRDSEKKYNRYFESLVGSINAYHWKKATLIVNGFSYFMLRLAIALGSVQDETAFQ